MFKARILVCILIFCWAFAASAQASQRVQLRVGFSPDKLGASTTIMVGFKIATASGRVPSPLTNVNIRLPAGVSLSTSTLGLDVCDPAVLEGRGLSGCSPNALMGFGSALVEVPFGPVIAHENVSIAMLMGPPANGHTTMLFYVNGLSPVYAQLVFPGVLLPDSGPFGAHLDTAIPLTPSLPGAPNAAVVYLQSSLGPRNLIYYKRIHNRRIAYRPRGVTTPTTCPHGGFPFAAIFSFEDGTTTTATSTVACPPQPGSSHKSKGKV
jgi:hypothetical protein